LVAADGRAGADPARAARHRRLAARDEHPDVFVLSPAGTSLRREEEVSQLVVEASRTPVEGSRKVLVVDRFHAATPAAAAALLKPVEEPPGSVVWVLLAEQVLPEHVTIASRCARVDFGPVPDAEIARVLASEGLAAADRAPLVAAAAAGIEVLTYSIIYELLDEMEQMLVGRLAPTREETLVGVAQVRAIFRVPRLGAVAGCYVTEGRIAREARARVVRDGSVVYDGRVASLRRFKEDVSEVVAGYECGVGLERFRDVKEGDVIETYRIDEIAAT